ncbi:MAG: hypothetical protein J7525_14715 [Roseofilum sp. SID3]|uniref:hypothetical protein n=1 Tax=Roseofilum sp. SID3 TaxID=2821499 RepID=UPI001B0C4B21|nr:hypothetical protein [Roseofilum sp. SID3]MBP0014348.1 hypothetical protein [Roseofilum sp. SID3]
MFAIIALIVGIAAGIAIAYWLMEKRLDEQKQALEQKHQKAIEDLERSHQFRLDKTVEDIREQTIADAQQSAQTHPTDIPAQAARPDPSEPSQATQDAQQSLKEIKTLVAQESRIRQVTLAQRERYQSQAQQAVQSLEEQPKPPEDPPIPYTDSAPAPSATNPSPPHLRS